MNGNRPANEIKVGAIKATIWANQNSRGDYWYSVNFVRLYKDGEQWKESAALGRDDLPVVSKIADMAYTWIWQNDKQPRSEHVGA